MALEWGEVEEGGRSGTTRGMGACGRAGEPAGSTYPGQAPGKLAGADIGATGSRGGAPGTAGPGWREALPRRPAALPRRRTGGGAAPETRLSPRAAQIGRAHV